MLHAASVLGYVLVADRERARRFYVETLGLALRSEDEAGFVVGGPGGAVRVTPLPSRPEYAFPIVGWEVHDVRTAVRWLADRGVAVERYDGLDHDELGVWTSPTGVQVAWFCDPDGNTLSVSTVR